MAQEFLKAAKAKMEAQAREAMARAEAADRQAREQELAKRRLEAQRVAMETANAKAKLQVEQERQAKQQLFAARERQLKGLYEQGLDLYRRGNYQESIDQLQKMALLDPRHPLIKNAEHLISRAELKLLDQRARASASSPPGVRDAMVTELEKFLTEKRIEQETLIKYARSAIKEHNYDTAIELLYRVLKTDPNSRPAQVLLEQARLAKLEGEETHLQRNLAIDEQQMANDVLKAEMMPPDRTKRPPIARPTGASSEPSTVMSKLTEPVSFDFQDVPLTDVVDFLADAASVSIIPSPHVDMKQQRVSMRADKLPLELALKYLTKNQGLAYRVEDGVILIATPEEFANEPLETRVMYLKCGLGPFALETAAVDSNPALAMDNLKKLLEQSITQPSGSKLVIDERTGSLIVTNTSDNLRRIEKLLSQLDIVPLQVLIEARFVEITLTDLEQVGIESVLNGNAALNKKGSPFGTQGPANQINSGSGFKFPTLSREGEGLNLTLQGVLTGVQFESVLHLLEEKQKSKTLSAPRVTTLNNQTATIKVVEEFRYPTRYEVSLVQFDINGDGDFDDAGETEFVNVPQNFQKRDVGILLNVTPSVGKAGKTITLVLAPEVSQFSQFRDLGGGVTVPEFTSSQLTTSVVIEHGQTVVLGGLMKDATSTTTTKVPILGDLPLVGNLFRQKEETQTRKNLLIFVTARVLAPSGQTI